jgi:hemoglobin
MVVEYIRYSIADADAAGFEQAWADAAQYLDRDENCHGYELARCEEDPKLYILRIEWTSTEAHMKGFRRSPAFPAFFKCIQPHLKAIQEMHHYVPTMRSAASR